MIGNPFTYKGEMSDLREVAKSAANHLGDPDVRHIVYGYIKKEDPKAIIVLDWDMLFFHSDKEFEDWYETNKDELEMVYAVHSFKQKGADNNA